VGSERACGWQESGDWSQAVGFLLVHLASIIVNMFTHLVYFIKKFYTFCAFEAICEHIVPYLYRTAEILTQSCEIRYLILCIHQWS
jgi:hypothetical protein